jgi:carboxyl-terminal processing protease
LRATLDEFVGERITTTARAREAIRKIVIAGSQLGLPPGIVALECACGAANSLDEYSLYLAPGRMTQAQAALKNKVVGIGIELTLVGQRLEVSRVYRQSPAADKGLLKGDRLLRIDGMWVNPLAPDLAVERLLGEAGSFVEVEYVRSGQTMPVTEKIERQVVVPVSAEGSLREVQKGTYVGYLQIHNFQESTLQEVKDILAGWQSMPLRGIIMDLRGNPGGVFRSALQVAELFLPESVIVQTISRVPGLSRTYESHNMSPCPLPLVVLIDGETASAAELLAGTLKENKRAELIGSSTYGKHSIQNVYPLERGPGGLRLTVARFTSPSGSPFSSKGIQPNILVTDPDAILPRAVEVLLNAMMMN